MADEPRKALLIGVPEAPGAVRSFGPLDAPVQADLHTLRSALEASGYDVETGAAAGRAAISARIFEVSRKVPQDGTLLLYFSGHGLRLGDVDYLVPADALAPDDEDWQPPYLGSLLPADISPYLGQCRAGTVIWLIDACRDETHGATDGFGTAAIPQSPKGRFAVLVGCTAGQQCGYTDEGSFFTAALADAFRPMTAPQTVQEIYESARVATARAARRHGARQDVQIRYVAGREEETAAAVVSSGRRLLESWRDAVTDEDLWRLVAPDTTDCSEQLREQLLALVDACAQRVQQAQQRLADPWADDGYPVRVLTQLRLLLPKADGLELSAIELTGLLAAPFLREAAWADLLARAAELQPLDPDHLAQPGPLRGHLEQVQSNYPHLRRKLVRSLALKREGEAQVLALWLVHRWIAERFEEDPDPLPAGLADSFAQQVVNSDDPDWFSPLSSALRRLALETGLDGIVEYDHDAEPVSVRVTLRSRQQLRVRPLAVLLRLAGVLAVDARTFPDVLADHLAVADPAHPSDLIDVLQRSLDWVLDQGRLALDLPSPHQAVHAGLSDVVERADRLAASANTLARQLPEPEQRLLALLPARVSDTHLRPRRVEGRPAYEVPLLRFHLAQAEVRDLLMGRQLYGDPLLAIRELYQNAMDACRYRAKRWQYLRSRGMRPLDWEGTITLRHGEDERGRYIECHDNGVGMGLEQLKGTFTRAGSRFEQSRSFRREQASWLRHDPELRLYPNSRFGIGVLSYFMLADQLTIVTRQVDADGSVAPQPYASTSRVAAVSSGSNNSPGRARTSFPRVAPWCGCTCATTRISRPSPASMSPAHW
ncbi:hypothetical protein GXW82_31225 [Streptacidiphilus sp. 4-A2]|nr:hypothetical protein [Streptacidiphilus sp. 4-A2]